MLLLSQVKTQPRSQRDESLVLDNPPFGRCIGTAGLLTEQERGRVGPANKLRRASFR